MRDARAATCLRIQCERLRQRLSLQGMLYPYQPGV